MVATLRARKELEVLSLHNIECLVDRMLKDEHYVWQEHGFAFYVKCDDAMLKAIQEHKEYLMYPDLAAKLLAGKGQHVHFIGIYSTLPDSDGYEAILKGMAKLIDKEKPASISWYNRTMQKFIIRRLSWAS